MIHFKLLTFYALSEKVEKYLFRLYRTNIEMRKKPVKYQTNHRTYGFSTIFVDFIPCLNFPFLLSILYYSSLIMLRVYDIQQLNDSFLTLPTFCRLFDEMLNQKSKYWEVTF